jgi:predicted N-acetyltransferase YhbS
VRGPRVQALYSVVAGQDGTIVGSNFLDERSTIRGVGPITLAPVCQNGGIGRAFMEDILARARERRAPGVRPVLYL